MRLQVLLKLLLELLLGVLQVFQLRLPLVVVTHLRAVAGIEMD